MAALSFTLLDPRPVAASAPYTAFLPSPTEVEAVRTGDIVKLIFEYDHETDQWPMEGMWVIVAEVGDDALVGVLDNDPSEPKTFLVAGDRIPFQRHHIVDIHWAHPDKAPPRGERREYWDRCLVDACVLDGSRPIAYVSREEPSLHGDDGEHRDSGWRIGGQFDLGNVSELHGRQVEYVALDVVLNQDDSWLHLIDAPVGSRFLRDFNTGLYLKPGEPAA